MTDLATKRTSDRVVVVHSTALPETLDGDDIAAVYDGAGIVLAWSAARVDYERVRIGRLGDNENQTLVDGEAHEFRPALTTLAGGALAAGCARWAGGRRYRPAFLFLDETGPPHRFNLASEGDAFGIALAPTPSGERAWVAWEERQGTAGRVRAGLLDPEGRFDELALPSPATGTARSPALVPDGSGGAILAWVASEGAGRGAVMLSRLSGRASGPPRAACKEDGHQEAPALAALPGGEVAVAWHTDARAGGAPDLVRWLRVHGGGLEGRLRQVLPRAMAEEREADGEDQGWEFPSVLGAADGSLWVAGRSSHGFHVMAWRPGRGWTERSSVSPARWGGRGRRTSLVEAEGQIILVTRDWEGVTCALLEVRAQSGSPPPPPQPMPTSVTPVRPPPPVAEVLFGDLHMHGSHSDGLGTVEELYLLCRDRRGLDFAAVTEHDAICRRAIGPGTWAYLRSVTDAFHDPDRFSTLHGWEFTGERCPGPGHKCVIFADSIPDRIPEKDVSALFEVVRHHGGIAFPAHTGWSGADLEHHDPSVQPVWEICSLNGCYEHPASPVPRPPRPDVVIEGEFLSDALAAGHRFGFVASSDSHGLLWHHGISPHRDPFRTGLTGLPGAGRTRAEIVAALRARRCYATSGARIALRVELDGAPMGSELPAGTSGGLLISVAGTAPLKSVDLVGPDGATAVSTEGGAALEAVVPLDRPEGFRYVRVIQEDGEAAWASPLFFGEP